MARTVEILTQDGQTLLFEAAPDPAGRPPVGFAPAARGIEDLPAKAGEALRSAFAPVRRLADELQAEFEKIKVKPDSVEVCVGFKITASAGVIFTQAGGEATMTVKMTWRPGAPPKPAAGS